MRGEAVWLVASLEAADLLRIVERLKSQGLSPEAPAAGSFRTWGETEGAAEPPRTTSREFFESWQEKPGNVAFSLWRNDREAVVVLEPAAGYSRLDFQLRDWSEEMAEFLAATILWTAITEPKSVGLYLNHKEPDSHDDRERFLASPSSSIPLTADLVWYKEPALFWVRPSVWVASAPAEVAQSS